MYVLQFYWHPECFITAYFLSFLKILNILNIRFAMDQVHVISANFESDSAKGWVLSHIVGSESDSAGSYIDLGGKLWEPAELYRNMPYWVGPSLSQLGRFLNNVTHARVSNKPFSLSTILDSFCICFWFCCFLKMVGSVISLFSMFMDILL